MYVRPRLELKIERSFTNDVNIFRAILKDLLIFSQEALPTFLPREK